MHALGATVLAFCWLLLPAAVSLDAVCRPSSAATPVQCPVLLQSGVHPSKRPGASPAGATHLISFRSCSQNASKPCNRRFFEELRHLSQAAAKIPVITHHHLYQGLPKELEANPRWSRHVKEGLRGRGFWFWKPALVNLLVSDGTLRDGDTVVWADADDCAYIAKQPGDDRMWEDVLANARWDIFVKNSGYCEMAWTKGDIFRHFGVPWFDTHYGLTPQVHAQFWVVRLSPKTRTFLRHWEDLMADLHLVSDEQSESSNSPFFYQNRHDQSMLSMLMKANDPEMEPDRGECRRLLQRPSGAAARGNLSLAARPWRRHRTYGIEGLSAKIGDFRKEPRGSSSRSGGSHSQASLLDFAPDDEFLESPSPTRRGPPSRSVCIRGLCSDLDSYPTEAVPEGVDSSDAD